LKALEGVVMNSKTAHFSSHKTHAHADLSDGFSRRQLALLVGEALPRNGNGPPGSSRQQREIFSVNGVPSKKTRRQMSVIRVVAIRATPNAYRENNGDRRAV